MSSPQTEDSKLHIDTRFSQIKAISAAMMKLIETESDEANKSYWTHELMVLVRHEKAVEFVNTYVPHPYDPEIVFLSQETFPALWDHLADAISHVGTHVDAIEKIHANDGVARVFGKLSAMGRYHEAVAKFLDDTLKANKRYNDAFAVDQTQSAGPGDVGEPFRIG